MAHVLQSVWSRRAFYSGGIATPARRCHPADVTIHVTVHVTIEKNMLPQCVWTCPAIGTWVRRYACCAVQVLPLGFSMCSHGSSCSSNAYHKPGWTLQSKSGLPEHRGPNRHVPSAPWSCENLHARFHAWTLGRGRRRLHLLTTFCCRSCRHASGQNLSCLAPRWRGSHAASQRRQSHP